MDISKIRICFSTLFAHTMFACTFTSFIYTLMVSIILLPCKSLLKSNFEKNKYDNLEALEKRYLAAINSEGDIQRKITHIESSKIDVNVASLIKTASNCDSYLLFVHGTSASSLGFATCMMELSKLDPTLEIHAIDLPGFGVSLFGNSDHVEQAKQCSKEYIIDFYCEILEKYVLHHFHGKQIILMGHSFGGFLCTHFVSRYPDLIAKFIAVDIAGIFPMLGEYGKEDTIMPSHQGGKICEVLHQENLSLHVISNASHVPYVENQHEFCKVVKQIIDTKQKVKPIQIGKYDKIKFKLREHMLKECIGTFCLSDTLKSIEKQYKIFHEIVNENGGSTI